MGWRKGDRDVPCCSVGWRLTGGEQGGGGGRQGEGAVFDGPAGSSVPVSASSPALCCPLGVTERTSAGPFLNVQKKVQVYGEGRKL